jgi:hypothetical protein
MADERTFGLGCPWSKSKGPATGKTGPRGRLEPPPEAPCQRISIHLPDVAAYSGSPFLRHSLLEVKEHHREHPKAICERAKIGRGWRACPGPSGTSPERMVCNSRLWSAHKGSTTLVGLSGVSF